MESLNFSKYKRAFFFGCSFTQYYWPTWADLISKEIPESYLYAKCGAGNFFIYQAVIEAIVKHKINEDDLVMIMFSNVTREDRYTRKEGWITPGNLFYQQDYDKKFLDRFFCEKGYLMRDLSLIEGLHRVLNSTKSDFYFMSMVGLDSLQGSEIKIEDVDEVLTLYKSTIEKLKPSFFDVIFEGSWNARPQFRPRYDASWGKNYVDNHPTPIEHLEYILKIFPGTVFKQSTIDAAHYYTEQLLKCSSQAEIQKLFNDILKPLATRL